VPLAYVCVRTVRKVYEVSLAHLPLTSIDAEMFRDVGKNGNLDRVAGRRLIVPDNALLRRFQNLATLSLLKALE